MIGKLIKAKIEDTGLSVSELEKKAGIRPGSIYNILSGRSKNPTVSTIRLIANGLGCSINEFINSDYGFNNSTKEIVESDVNWDIEIYFACMSYLKEALKNRRSIIAKKKFLELVDETYFYSTKVKALGVDERFADWILDKALNA